MAEVRSLFLHYHDVTRQLTRFKSKLSATFRQVAVCASGTGLYESSNRDQWLAQLQPHPALACRARHWFTLVDTLGQIKQDTFAQVMRRVRPLPAFAHLCSMPGVASVIAAGYIALIITPHRFSHKNRLWRYARLGFKEHESDGRIYQRGASRYGHPVLKWLVRQHFQAAVERPRQSNRFQRQYRALRAAGLDETGARRQVCRSLLSVVLALWTKGESYRDRPMR
jgi:transposase